MWTRRLRTAIWFVGIGCGFLLVAVLLILQPWSLKWTPAGLRAAIAADLPVGSTQDQVISWLDARHIDHGRLSGNDGQLSQTVTAEILDSYQYNFESWDIQVYFYFDRDGGLEGYKLETFDVSL
jgi:hypothetical protein